MQTRSIMSVLAGGVLALALTAAPTALRAQRTLTVLGPPAMQRLMPSAVFYDGQVATTQLRNSGGVKFSDGHYVLISLVDTSGYSSGVAAKYQAYFITEVPLRVGGAPLRAGVYGIGFISNHKFVVTDVGGHDVLTVESANDSAMKRPMPLQVLAGSGSTFRVYVGRSYVVMSR